MNKKRKISAVFFLKIFILNIFFLYFSENIFGDEKICTEKDKYSDGVCFAQSFYSDVYDKTEYKKESLKNISIETGLSEKIIIDFYNSKLKTTLSEECSNRYKETIKKCNEEGKNNSGQKNAEKCKGVNISEFCYFTIYTSKDYGYNAALLKNKIEKELKLIKLKEELKSTGEFEEIFADGDYKNSFFDIITQWNIIDVILFGKDGMTPFFKYNKPDKNNSNFKDDILNTDNPGDKNNANNPNDNPNENTDKDKDLNQNPQNEISGKNNTDKITFVEEIVNNSENTDKNKSFNTDEICIDPYLVDIPAGEVVNLSENNPNGDKINPDNETLDRDLIKNPENNLDENIIIGNKTTQNEFGFYEPIESENKENDDSKPKTKGKAGGGKCNKSIYGGYICLDELQSGCIPIGKKIEGSKEGKNGHFCWNIKFITGTANVFGNSEAVNCINCYIKKSLQIIENEINGEAIFPRENSIKNGNLPNIIGIKRDSSIFDISYKPMSWDKENYQKNKKYEEYTIVENYSPKHKNDMDKTNNTSTLVNNISKTDLKISNNYKKYDKMKSDKKESVAVIKDGYLGDVNGRITEFRDLFQSGILKSIESLPFKKIEKIKNTSCQSLKN